MNQGVLVFFLQLYRAATQKMMLYLVCYPQACIRTAVHRRRRGVPPPDPPYPHPPPPPLNPPPLPPPPF